MNWKFWQWPRRIQVLEAELRAVRANAQPTNDGPKWSATFDPAPFRQRLAELPSGDTVLPLWLGYIDACIVAHADLKCSPEMANQLVGKINALTELKNDFKHLWNVAHSAPGEKK